MNTVPGHIVEEVADNAESDRWRGMKLVSPVSAKKRSILRIDVDDSLLKKEAMPPSRKRPASRNTDFPENEPPKVQGAMIVLATVAGLAIGFLVGRKRIS